ncbi:acyl-CoA dehydrogenase family protein [Falsigemmobacter faecalis]|uniref:Acyl-CoA dehydrogenase n=1 Tax=Falsigemmobacter faecalis TaxID=2488730 RepID=A0A3P3DFW2_9RHOB|nr:acyl-CoA dehydrogenase family protein [Falsigemmobacter faecalis]RRH72412.1 acyl-CoA dehydrogenase [Falsigemmobacter faecalis]
MELPEFPVPPAAGPHAALRAEVRAFLKTALPRGFSEKDRAQSWTGFDAGFSRALGAAGFIGMTWSPDYGGHGRSFVERQVVLEELLAAGAPVAAHWIADRQSAPMILRNGTEAQRREILPKIAAGTCYFCIGMSEPDSGSDLASARSRAERRSDGRWTLSGTKLWTTYAHKSHYMICFCRTSASEVRHGGFSQFLVDLSLPGITIRPVRDISGAHHFNEVHFDEVILPEDALLGREGEGWAQVMAELSFERSGPERFLSSFPLAEAFLRAAPDTEESRRELGRQAAHLMVLRQMSHSVAGRLQAGERPDLHAAIVKDLGADFEQQLPERLRPCLNPLCADDSYRETFDHIRQAAPSYSLRGGTREILRGIIARGLGLH